jgi:hypothetical protein
MTHRLLAVVLGGLMLIPVSSALAVPANVTLRVEGTAQTLVARTALHTDTRTVNKDGVAGHDCTGTSAAGALEIGTGGDWSGSFFTGLGYAAERIGSESHVFPDPSFYSLWINNRSSTLGLCQAELQEGDDVLLFVDHCDPAPAPVFCANPPVQPLGLTGPSTAFPGASFDVTVVAFAFDGTPAPEAGATVTGGVAPVTTNAAGVAAVTLPSGPATLRASSPNRARSAGLSVCATAGADGNCGTNVPPKGLAPCATNGSDGSCGTRDATAPATRIEGIEDGQRYARGKGPRALRIVVDPDVSGLRTVKLRLTRNDRGRCTYYSGKSERFRTPREAKCGAANGFWFGIGDREQTTYLLPRALPRGHYVLDVNAIDKAFNRDDARRRGANRITFTVA